MTIDRIIILLAIGTAGSALARYLKLPSGTFIGAMVATGAFSLLVARPEPLPQGFRLVALLLLGVHIGSSVDRAVIRQIVRILPQAMSAILALIAVGFGMGWSVHQIAPTDISGITILLGCMPGGASGMAALAGELGADVRLVASMHIIRQITVFGVLPPFLRWLVERTPRAGGESGD